MTPNQKKDEVQGEGDYKADKRYVESTQAFVKSGKVEQAARDAKPKSAEEQKKLQDAEQQGKSHSKGEDPAAPGKSRPKP